MRGPLFVSRLATVQRVARRPRGDGYGALAGRTGRTPGGGGPGAVGDRRLLPGPDREGLLGRDAVDGALLLSPAGGVHTFGMRMPIDVAYLDRRLTVIAVRTMAPGGWDCPGCGPGTSWRRRPARWPGGG